MAFSLPRFFTLKYGTMPYLSVPENPPASLPGFVKFVETQILSPRAKFAAEPSQTGDGTLVNIRSCYNNKYWVAHKINNDYYVVASAAKPQEDQSKPECTLFQPQLRNNQQLLLFSVGLSLYLHSSTANNEWRYGITLRLQPPGYGFAVVDWETLTILPPQVSFRSEALEGDYLCSRFVNGGPYLLFEPGLDIGDPRVAHDLSANGDGSYRIDSAFFGKSWRRNWQANSFIWADGGSDGYGNRFTFFKISDSIFALRDVGTSRFCAGDTDLGIVKGLRASYSTLERQTRLTVEERVLQRQILNLRYRLSDSRIYQEEIKEVSNAFATNNSPDKETTITLSYSSSDSQTTSWADSKSSKFGVNVNFSVTIVPLIVKSGIDLSAEYGRTFEWGESETAVSTRTASYTVVVPPLTQIKVTLMSTTAACDVPFSYTQRDLLPSGQWVTTIKDDGIFTGFNSYNFYFDSSEQPINDQAILHM